MATHFHPLQIKDVRRETAGCISVAFAVPPHLQAAFAFTQGQNITVKATIDGEELRRSYSVCSSPLDNELRIAVKKVTDGKFSTWANANLKKGSFVEVLPPTGKFFTPLHAANKKHYMAFAAGSGITPLLSIIKTTLAIETNSRFTLIYGNKNRTSIIFREELEALKNKYINRFSVHHILSREKTDSPLNEGRIDEEKCQLIFQHLVDIKSCDDFFVCGPEAMIYCVRDFLAAKGIEKTNVHVELFTVPGSRKTEAGSKKAEEHTSLKGKQSNITIRLDGISFDLNLAYDGDPILDAALKTGADLPYACKGGVCATCRAKLVSGEVVMDTNYALEPEEITNGYILTCQSHPRSEHLIVDFDQK